MQVLGNVLMEDWFRSDAVFNLIYSPPIQSLAKLHWTPLDVVACVTDFLVTGEGVKILDIGSGVGKFCLAAARRSPSSFFYGVEQRESLVGEANQAKERLQLSNVSFFCGNFTQIDVTKFDHFYFYNSFYENLSCNEKIDDDIEYSVELYNYYNRYLYQQLEQTPTGTRLCTLCSMEEEIPPSFHEIHSERNGLLKFWEKIQPEIYE